MTSARLEAARRSAKPVHDLAAGFMLDLETYAQGAAAGYDGVDFYFAGRGGVLGEVDAATVADALVFFPLATVAAAWEAAGRVEPRRASAERFAEVGHRWAVAHLAEDGPDYDRLAVLAGEVVAAADGSTAPVFAGWRDLPEPSGRRELALHRMNALRELRAARHGAAVREVGLEPVEAFMVRTPYMAAVFGWPQPEGEPDEAVRARWNRAEELTDEAFAADLAALDDAELVEFCELSEAAIAAIV